MTAALRVGSRLEAVGGRADVVRLRTHANSDFVVFQIVFGLGAVAGAYFVGWPMALLAVAVLAFATWVRGHRTTIDLQARTFAVQGPWPSRGTAPKPVLPLSVRKSVKRSKGTVTVTFAVLGDGAELADGLVFGDAKELVEELAERLGVPAPVVPE